MKATAKKYASAYGSLLERDYEKRVAAFRRARGALAHHKKGLTRYLAQIRKDRDRPLPLLSKQ